MVAKHVEKVSDAEAEILKVLWAHGAPMTERQIRDALEEDFDWKPRTIETMIRRLVGKDVLIQEKKSVFYYSPAISAEEFERGRTVEFLNKVFGGNPKSLVSTMLNNDILSDGDLDDLKSYWEERGRKK